MTPSSVFVSTVQQCAAICNVCCLTRPAAKKSKQTNLLQPKPLRVADRCLLLAALHSGPQAADAAELVRRRRLGARRQRRRVLLAARHGLLALLGERPVGRVKVLVLLFCFDLGITIVMD